MGRSRASKAARRPSRRLQAPWLMALLLTALIWALIAWGGVRLHDWLT